MRGKERPSPVVAAFMTLGIVGFWVVGYVLTKDLRVENILGPSAQNVDEVITLLNQYGNPPCTTPRHCIVNVWSH